MQNFGEPDRWNFGKHGQRLLGSKLKPIKILFAIDEINVGGTEKQLIWLCENLPKELFQPEICVFNSSNYLESLSLCTKVHNLRWNKYDGVVVRNVKLLAKVLRFLRGHRYDLIQTHFQDCEIFFHFAKFLCLDKAKYISTRRNLFHNISDGYFKYYLCRFFVKQSKGILYNSYASLEKSLSLEKVEISQCRVIPNSIDTASFSKYGKISSRERYGIDTRAIVVGVVGNFRAIKGGKFFVEAAADIYKSLEKRKVVFVLVGKGEQQKELVELSCKLGIEQELIIFNNIDNPAEIISTFDVAVQPSLSESLSNVLLEYMASGKPIVATDVGDAPKVIDHGRNGLLVPKGDERALAMAVLQLLNQPEMSKKLGVEARVDAGKYWDEGVILELYKTYYMEIMQRDVV